MVASSVLDLVVPNRVVFNHYKSFHLAVWLVFSVSAPPATVLALSVMSQMELS